MYFKFGKCEFDIGLAEISIIAAAFVFIFAM